MCGGPSCGSPALCGVCEGFGVWVLVIALFWGFVPSTGFVWRFVWFYFEIQEGRACPVGLVWLWVVCGQGVGGASGMRKPLSRLA